VDDADATALIAAAVPAGRGPVIWADLGSGAGTFTRALWQLLGPGSRIYAVDQNSRVLAALKRWSAAAGADVETVTADFTATAALPGVAGGTLDGILLANALHFVADGEGVLRRLAGLIRPGGRVLIVEYERRAPSRWVPFPVSPERFARLAESAGLSQPAVVATQPSAFGGRLYAAVAERPVNPGV
jgi:SAM-dependent methyltransferase